MSALFAPHASFVLTLVVLGTMVVMGEKIPPAIMFMVGLCVALLVNYPNVDMQRQRIDAHARAALMMAGPARSGRVRGP